GADGPADGESSDVFVYSNGTFTNLGTLGGNSGIGNGINTSGQVTGYSPTASGANRAFTPNGDPLLDLDALDGAGQVVGSSVTEDGSNHPFLYSNGQMSDLGTLGSPQGGEWWNSAEG